VQRSSACFHHALAVSILAVVMGTEGTVGKCAGRMGPRLHSASVPCCQNAAFLALPNVFTPAATSACLTAAGIIWLFGRYLALIDKERRLHDRKRGVPVYRCLL